MDAQSSGSDYESVVIQVKKRSRLTALELFRLINDLSEPEIVALLGAAQAIVLYRETAGKS